LALVPRGFSLSSFSGLEDARDGGGGRLETRVQEVMKDKDLNENTRTVKRREASLPLKKFAQNLFLLQVLIQVSVDGRAGQRSVLKM
jgi:hypothetical protein